MKNEPEKILLVPIILFLLIIIPLTILATIKGKINLLLDDWTIFVVPFLYLELFFVVVYFFSIKVFNNLLNNIQNLSIILITNIVFLFLAKSSFIDLNKFKIELIIIIILLILNLIFSSKKFKESFLKKLVPEIIVLSVYILTFLGSIMIGFFLIVADVDYFYNKILPEIKEKIENINQNFIEKDKQIVKTNEQEQNQINNNEKNITNQEITEFNLEIENNQEAWNNYCNNIMEIQKSVDEGHQPWRLNPKELIFAEAPLYGFNKKDFSTIKLNEIVNGIAKYEITHTNEIVGSQVYTIVVKQPLDCNFENKIWILQEIKLNPILSYYENEEVGFFLYYSSIHTSLTEDYYMPSDGEFKDTIKIKIINLNNFQDRTLGYTKENLLNHKNYLEKGVLGGLEIDWARNRKLLKLDCGLYAEEEYVLGRFEVGNIVFEKRIRFFINNYMVEIISNGVRDPIIEENPNYFEKCGIECLDWNDWKWKKGGMVNFINDLEKNKKTVSLNHTDRWINNFDDTIKTINLKNKEGIAKIAFKNHLNQYLSANTLKENRLDEYTINEVNIFEDSIKNNCFSFWVIFSVKPYLSPSDWLNGNKESFSDWIAGNGYIEGGWILNKSLAVDVIKINNEYSVRKITGTAYAPHECDGSE